jgi:hypothetical protein
MRADLIVPLSCRGRTTEGAIRGRRTVAPCKSAVRASGPPAPNEGLTASEGSAQEYGTSRDPQRCIDLQRQGSAKHRGSGGLDGGARLHALGRGSCAIECASPRCKSGLRRVLRAPGDYAPTTETRNNLLRGRAAAYPTRSPTPTVHCQRRSPYGNSVPSRCCGASSTEKPRAASSSWRRARSLYWWLTHLWRRPTSRRCTPTWGHSL